MSGAGWTLKSAAANGDTVSDSAEGDAVICTVDPSARLVFACGNGSRSSLSVHSDGIDVPSLPDGAVLVASGGTGRVSHDSMLQFDRTTANLTASNMRAVSRMHSDNIVIGGGPGTTRFRLSVSNDSLVVSRINKDGTEEAIVDIDDVALLLSKVQVTQ